MFPLIKLAKKLKAPRPRRSPSQAPSWPFPLIKLAKKLKAVSVYPSLPEKTFPLIKLAKKLKAEVQYYDNPLEFPLIKLAKKLKECVVLEQEVTFDFIVSIN